MKVAILGYDTEGKLSYDYFKAQGADITICDQNLRLEVPNDAHTVLGDNYLDDLDGYDLLVRTAGMPPQKILDKNPGIENKITTQINEFLRVCPTKNVIGVTGTKGKGTTSSLIYEMLKADGKTAYLGGNIGVPPFSFLNKLSDTDWVVLELSSFQLSDIKYSPHIAVCLMIVSEHLNWHTDFDDYCHAKSNLFANQMPEDIAIYYSQNDNSKKVIANSSGTKIPYFSPPGAYIESSEIKIDDTVICKTSEIKLLGEHNWQNVCAAITAIWQVTQNVEAIRSVVISFSGMEHRLQLVKEIAGVKYYDDSFGTTPETAIVAIKSFEQPKIVILGGSDKGATYNELAKTVSENNVRKVLLIGEQADRIEKSLKIASFTNYLRVYGNMSEIVSTAKNISQPGDVVLLSPACASFDMFKNYKDRANQFISAVEAL